MATALYGPSNFTSYHTDKCHHSRPLVKVEGQKVPDPNWAIACDDCEADRRKLGHSDDILERPQTDDEIRKAKLALERSHLTVAQSQSVLAEILAKLVAQQGK